jgi:hypothetical protein
MVMSQPRSSEREQRLQAGGISPLEGVLVGGLELVGSAAFPLEPGEKTLQLTLDMVLAGIEDQVLGELTEHQQRQRRGDRLDHRAGLLLPTIISDYLSDVSSTQPHLILTIL